MKYETLLTMVCIVFNDLFDAYKLVQTDKKIIICSKEREFFIRFTLCDDETLEINYGLTHLKMAPQYDFNHAYLNMEGEKFVINHEPNIESIINLKKIIEKSHHDELYGISLANRLTSIGFSKENIVEAEDKSPDYQTVLIIFENYGIEITRNLWFVDYQLLSSFGPLNEGKNKLINHTPLSTLLGKIFSDFDSEKIVFPNQESVDYLLFYLCKLIIYCADSAIEKILEKN